MIKDASIVRKLPHRVSLSIYSKALRIIELLLEKTERKIWTTFHLQMDLDSPARHVIKIMETDQRP